MALVTDGRFSGETRGFMVKHVAPEAAVGRPVATVNEGDPITIDIQRCEINIDIPKGQLQSRLALVISPKPKYTHGVMAMFAALVGSAWDGAITSQLCVQTR